MVTYHKKIETKIYKNVFFYGHAVHCGPGLQVFPLYATCFYIFVYDFLDESSARHKALLAQYKRYTDKSHLPLSLVEIFVNHDSRVRAIVDRMYIGLGGHAELASNH